MLTQKQKIQIQERPKKKSIKKANNTENKSNKTILLLGFKLV